MQRYKRELWVDVTIVFPVLPTYVGATAAERAAATAATTNANK